MSFFNLTHLGYQDTIREHVREPEFTPQNHYRSGDFRDPGKLPPISETKDLPQASIVPINQTSGYGPGPHGSHVEFTRMRSKHIRKPDGPLEIYRYPIATSQEVARWRKDEPINVQEPWMHVPRQKRVKSAMTRFVDEMALTNREFSLF